MVADIMNKAQALYQYWSSFASAIDEQSAYDDDALKNMNITYPYITYETATGNIGNDVSMSADIWDKSTSWATVTELAEKIAKDIGYGGKLLAVDGGYIWIKLGNPFAQRMAVADSDSIRRINLNYSAEFLTAT